MSNFFAHPFRANIANTTLATAPVVVGLNISLPVIHEIVIWSTSNPDVSKSGWRLKNRGVILLPTVGSSAAEVGFSPAAGEFDWNPIPATTVRIPMEITLEGAPFDTTLEFFNNGGAAAYLIGGFVISGERQRSINELVLEMARERALIVQQLKLTAGLEKEATKRESHDRGPH